MKEQVFPCDPCIKFSFLVLILSSSSSTIKNKTKSVADNEAVDTMSAEVELSTSEQLRVCVADRRRGSKRGERNRFHFIYL